MAPLGLYILSSVLCGAMGGRIRRAVQKRDLSPVRYWENNTGDDADAAWEAQKRAHAQQLEEEKRFRLLDFKDQDEGCRSHEDIKGSWNRLSCYTNGTYSANRYPWSPCRCGDNFQADEHGECRLCGIHFPLVPEMVNFPVQDGYVEHGWLVESAMAKCAWSEDHACTYLEISNNGCEWSAYSIDCIMDDRNVLGPKGLRIIKNALEHMPYLTVLGLDANDLRADGMGILRTILPHLPALQQIELTWNKLGDEGASILYDALAENPNIESIFVEHNEISTPWLDKLSTKAHLWTAKNARKWREEKLKHIADHPHKDSHSTFRYH